MKSDYRLSKGDFTMIRQKKKHFVFSLLYSITIYGLGLEVHYLWRAGKRLKYTTVAFKIIS